MSNNNEMWSSRWIYIMAAMSMAVGTGNIWRFPRMVAQNGGGSFLIGWAVFLILWSVPLILVEIHMGRKTRLATPGAFRDFIGGKFTWLGMVIAVICAFLAANYAVVTGWTLKYATLALSGQLLASHHVDTFKLWEAFSTNRLEMLIFFALGTILCSFVVYLGVKRGIEKVTKVLMPGILLLLIITAFRACSLDGAAAGLNYFFTPQWEYLTKSTTWLQALSQSAWSTGAGWGLYATYAIYTSAKEDIARNGITAAVGNNSVELLAGLTVIPALFALAPSPEFIDAAMGDGKNLTFIYIAQLTQNMPFGSVTGIFFFVALFFAAFTSLIAMIEYATKVIMDYGISRGKSITVVTAFLLCVGSLSAVSWDVWNNQDWVWGVGLLVSCMLFAFAAHKYGIEKMRNEINEVSDVKVGKWWFNFAIGYAIPVIAVVFIGWWVWQSMTWYPGTWWNPKEVFGVGAIVVQVGIISILALAFNNWMSRRIIKGEMSGDNEKGSLEKGAGSGVGREMLWNLLQLL